MSSRLSPLVSGTKQRIKIKTQKQTHPHTMYMCPNPMAWLKSGTSFPTPNKTRLSTTPSNPHPMARA